jgi:hypothetical protein
MMLDPADGRLSENRPEPLCGAWLRNAKEPCARRAGHRGSHRSAWAMQYDRERHRQGRGVAA